MPKVFFIIIFMYKMLPLTINKIYYILVMSQKMVFIWVASTIEKIGLKSPSINKKDCAKT